MRLGSFLLLIVAVAVASGCEQVARRAGLEDEPGKLVVIFADVSQTVTEADWELYRETYEQILDGEDALIPGDRVVLSTISSTTLTEFAPVGDVSIPRSGIALNDAEAADLSRLRIRISFEDLRKTQPSQETHIVDAAHVAAQLFRNDTSRSSRHLVLLSDMLEESKDANFRLRPPDDNETAELLERLTAAGRVPDLQGANIYVVGARASTSESMIQIERFWSAFFMAAGADLRPGDYSRAGALLRLHD